MTNTNTKFTECIYWIERLLYISLMYSIYIIIIWTAVKKSDFHVHSSLLKIPTYNDSSSIITDCGCSFIDNIPLVEKWKSSRKIKGKNWNYRYDQVVVNTSTIYKVDSITTDNSHDRNKNKELCYSFSKDRGDVQRIRNTILSLKNAIGGKISSYDDIDVDIYPMKITYEITKRSKKNIDAHIGGDNNSYYYNRKKNHEGEFILVKSHVPLSKKSYNTRMNSIKSENIKCFIGIFCVSHDFKLRGIHRKVHQRVNINSETKTVLVDFRYIYANVHSHIPYQNSNYFNKTKYLSDIKSQLKQENDTYGDLIELSAIPERMNNEKSKYFFYYIHKNYPHNMFHYDYFGKADLDSFIHVNNLIYQLKMLPRYNLYYGIDNPPYHSTRSKFGKVFTANLERCIFGPSARFGFSCPDWPHPNTFKMSGGFYLYSYDLVDTMLQVQNYFVPNNYKTFMAEDARMTSAAFEGLKFLAHMYYDFDSSDSYMTNYNITYPMINVIIDWYRFLDMPNWEFFCPMKLQQPLGIHNEVVLIHRIKSEQDWNEIIRWLNLSNNGTTQCMSSSSSNHVS